jgi:hypothetical protein
MFSLVLTLQKLTVRELADENLFLLYWRNYCKVRDFYFTVRNSLTVLVLVNDKYQAMNEMVKLIFLKF